MNAKPKYPLDASSGYNKLVKGLILAPFLPIKSLLYQSMACQSVNYGPIDLKLPGAWILM